MLYTGEGERGYTYICLCTYHHQTFSIYLSCLNNKLENVPDNVLVQETLMSNV